MPCAAWCSAERFSEAAIVAGSSDLKMSGSTSSASLRRVTSPDQRLPEPVVLARRRPGRRVECLPREPGFACEAGRGEGDALMVGASGMRG